MNKIDKLIKELCPNGVEWKELGDVCDFQRGRTITQKTAIEGDVPVIAGGQQPAYYHNEANREGETIAVSGSGAYAGYVSFWDIPIYLSDAFSVNPNKDLLYPRYVYHFLKSIQEQIYNTKQGVGVPHVYGSSISKFLIPLPPLPIQQEIVKILDKFTALEAELQAELDARRKQYEYYREKLLTFNEIETSRGGVSGTLSASYVEWKTLGELIISIKTGLNPRKNFKLNSSDANNFYVTVRELNTTDIIFTDKTDRVNDNALKLINNRSNLEKGDILFSGTGTIGRTALLKEKPKNWNIKEGIYVLKPNQKIINSTYLLHFLNSEMSRKQVESKTVGLPVRSIPMGEFVKILIPLPSFSEQNRIVGILDKFEELVNQSLPAEIEARRKQYEYYREKLLTFGTAGFPTR